MGGTGACVVEFEATFAAVGISRIDTSIPSSFVGERRRGDERSSCRCRMLRVSVRVGPAGGVPVPGPSSSMPVLSYTVSSHLLRFIVVEAPLVSLSLHSDLIVVGLELQLAWCFSRARDVMKEITSVGQQERRRRHVRWKAGGNEVKWIMRLGRVERTRYTRQGPSRKR